MSRVTAPRTAARKPGALSLEERPTAIVAAMSVELGCLRARTRVARGLRFGRCRVACGRLARTPVILAHTRDGRANATDGARQLLQRLPVGRLIVIGVSGGLSPELAPGALVAAQEVWDGNTPAPAPDATLMRLALQHPEVTAGAVLTSETILCTPKDKAAARKTLDRDLPAVVDLESAAFARAAAEFGVPYIVVRAVSDTAGEALPFDLNGCRDARGAVRRARVVRHVLGQPRLIGELWRLQRRVALCAERLAHVISYVVAGGRP